MTSPQVSVVIQAGGRSSRMGRDKALVTLGDKPMIAHVIERVEPLADELLITTNNQPALARFGYRMAADEEPGAGALPGLRTALAAARGMLVVLVACDMPFVNRKLLERQLALLGEADVVVPRWENRLQPMHAVYRREPCLAAVDAALAHGEKRMISWFGEVEVVEVSSAEIAKIDPNGYSFFNANTPDELFQAERLLLEI